MTRGFLPAPVIPGCTLRGRRDCWGDDTRDNECYNGDLTFDHPRALKRGHSPGAARPTYCRTAYADTRYAGPRGRQSKMPSDNDMRVTLRETRAAQLTTA